MDSSDQNMFFVKNNDCICYYFTTSDKFSVANIRKNLLNCDRKWHIFYAMSGIGSCLELGHFS